MDRRFAGLAGGLGGACLLAAALAGCATESPRSPSLAPDRPPVNPLYERTLQSPRGRPWDFQFGGGYSRPPAGTGGQYEGGGFSDR
jgi:hypothetical protein